MLLGLGKNVAISVVAFFLVSIFGLLIVPELIASYGLSGFGLIGIARMLLPTALLALFDLGYCEISTHSVAITKVTGSWSYCARHLGLNLALAFVMGLMSGMCLFVLSAWIPAWFRVPEVHQSQLTEVIRVTALLQPILLLSLVCEGVLKGFEFFRSQRLIEVISALSYIGAVFWALDRHLDFRWICYAYLASLILRAGLAACLAGRALSENRSLPALWSSCEITDFFQRVRILFPNKLIGLAQGQAPSFLVTILFGPISLGSFDLLTRLPRFTKSVLGLLNSTVQPVGARLDQLADEPGLRRLVRIGWIMVAGISAPVLGLAVAFSEPLLRLWIGPGISTLWGWQAAYFVVPSLGALVGFSGCALLGRTSVMKKINRLSIMNLTLVLFAGLLLGPWLRELAFVASTFLAAMITMPWSLSMMAYELGLPRSAFIIPVRSYAIALILALPVLQCVYLIDSFFALAAIMICWIAFYSIVLIFAGFPPSLRAVTLSRMKASLNIR